MKTRLLIIALVCLAAGTAFADVSNEVIVGLEGDSSKEIKQSVNGVETDLTGSMKNSHSQFSLSYTKFFDPLKDDNTAIELRRFLQHPTTLSAGLIAFGATEKDSTIPEDMKVNASLLVLGGEYYFPSGTGLFLKIGGGSGTLEDTVSGIKQPDTDISLGMYDLGIRHYVVPNLALHLAFTGDSSKTKQSGVETTSKTKVTLLGVEGVIENLVGLRFEIGGGSRTDEHGTVTDKFDVGQLNFGIGFYAGKQLSFRLDLEVEAAKQTGMPSGFEYTESKGRTTLSATYWFSEQFGMQLPIYSEGTEEKTISPLGENKLTTKNSGIGLYAAFRF
ncbi:MAG: hypothetical protein AABZ15_13865 [Nitrospirota bacterium]